MESGVFFSYLKSYRVYWFNQFIGVDEYLSPLHILYLNTFSNLEINLQLYNVVLGE